MNQSIQKPPKYPKKENNNPGTANEASLVNYRLFCK